MGTACHMSQLTIYLDEKSMKAVKAAARREKTSVSHWAREHLTQAARRSWPAGYFALFGALADSDLERPAQGGFPDDAPRRELD